MYLGMTLSLGVLLTAGFAMLGRGQALRLGKVLQIALEGAAYAIAMGASTSWLVGRLFAGPRLQPVDGPFASIVMSLGAGFYEELAFRVALFGLGAKALVWFVARKRLALAGSAPSLGLGAIALMIVWSIVCAAAFSAMHYLGAFGEPFALRSFVARASLGLALTLVYALRGFAAAVWTHALYDIWVLAF
jgi:hypothetical protein